jgi:hypothetical protein
MGNDTQEWLSPIYNGTGKGITPKGDKTILALLRQWKRAYMAYIGITHLPG